jgi:hypothetical protein
MAGCSCSAFQAAADRQFTADKAATELQAYRQDRLVPTTRRLRDGIVAGRVEPRGTARHRRTVNANVPTPGKNVIAGNILLL